MVEAGKIGQANRESVDVNLQHFQASLEAIKSGQSTQSGQAIESER